MTFLVHCSTVNAVSLTVDIALFLRFIDIETNNKISINIFFKTDILGQYLEVFFLLNGMLEMYEYS